MLRLLLFLVLLSPAAVFAQRGVYLSVDDFLAQNFTQPPQQQMLWLSPLQKTEAEQLANHPLGPRLRYFHTGERTAWVLDEIGKELPITVGVVIEHRQIISLQVLEFREIRGSEVRQRFFTDQFNGVSLKPDNHGLSARIDGITGATLSVRALKKMAKLALYFHQQVIGTTAEVAQP